LAVSVADPPGRVEVEAAQQLPDPAGVDAAAQFAVEVDQVFGGPAGSIGSSAGR
jgi:hypothetical protein